MKKPLQTVLLLFFAGTLVFSVWKLLSIHGSYQEGQNGYADLEQYVSFQEGTKPHFSEKTVPQETSPADVPESTGAPDLSAWPLVDFGQLSQINPDIVGWIFIEGTDINYPVVQGPIMTTICSICSMALITAPGASFWMPGAHLISRTDTASSTTIT